MSFQALTKTRSIVGLFNSSTILKEQLNQEQKLRGVPVLNVVQSVTTRWNSDYAMIDRIIAIHPQIERVLCLVDKYKKYLLSKDELLSLTAVRDLLFSFDQVTEILSADTYSTISLVIPCFTYLRKALATNSADSSFSKAFRDALRMVLNKYTSKYRIFTNETYIASTFLNPRYKSFKDCDKTEAATNVKNARAYIG